jgi:hypothetical protein
VASGKRQAASGKRQAASGKRQAASGNFFNNDTTSKFLIQNSNLSAKISALICATLREPLPAKH